MPSRVGQVFQSLSFQEHFRTLPLTHQSCFCTWQTADILLGASTCIPALSLWSPGLCQDTLTETSQPGQPYVQHLASPRFSQKLIKALGFLCCIKTRAEVSAMFSEESWHISAIILEQPDGCNLCLQMDVSVSELNCGK